MRRPVGSAADDGGAVIGEAGVVGQEQSVSSRFRLTSLFVAGSPVMDQRGDLLGMVVGAPAEETVGPVGRAFAVSGRGNLVYGTLVMPAEGLPSAPAAGVGLAELAARGEFLRPLSSEQRHVISGVFAARVQRGGVVPMPQDQKATFSRREGHASVFVQWNPQAKKDAVTRFEIYDPDYRLIGKGDPAKMKLRPGELFFSTWTFAIDRLPPSVYRVDLLLDEAPIWRGYLRITE